MFQIQILDSEDHLVHQISLGDKAVFIGRDPNCAICLPENSVSRRHASIEPRGALYALRDLDSTNGTWLNKQAVKEQILRSGDRIFVGSFRIVVKQSQEVRAGESFREMGGASIGDSAFTFDGSPRSEHTVRLDMTDELSAVLSGRHVFNRLIRLQEISQEIGLIETPEFLYNKVLKIILAELKADRACILVPMDGRGLKPVAAFSTIDGASAETIHIHEGVIETVVKDQTAILTADAAKDDRFRDDTAAGKRVHSVMSVPLIASKNLQGVLYVDRIENRNAFKDEDLRVFAVLGNQVATSLNNARLFQDVLSEKRKVQAIIDHLGDGLVITDGRLRIEKYNEAAARALVGDNHYFVGKSLLDILETRSNYFNRNDALAVVENGGKFQLNLITDDENQVYNVTVSSCPSSEGSQLGYIFSFKDMSEFASLGLLKTEFIRIASHKLRTPLTVLMGNVELLKHSPENPEDSLMSSVERNIRQLQTLVNRFVEFVELDQATEALEEIELREIIDLAWAGLVARAEEKNVTFERHFDVDGPAIGHGVVDRLVQGFSNILDNAIKFAPENSTVRILLNERDENYRIQIEDDGPGIPESHLPYIFCGFHQAEKISTGEAEGAGLGLTIAKRIFHSHGASIQASSLEYDVVGADDVGDDDAAPVGTRITIVFPKETTTLLGTCQIREEEITAFI